MYIIFDYKCIGDKVRVFWLLVWELGRFLGGGGRSGGWGMDKGMGKGWGEWGDWEKD